MDVFSDSARAIFDAAQLANARAEPASSLTFLFTRDHGVRMISECDWPLEAVAAEHGASMVYRLRRSQGFVRVEGKAGKRACLLEISEAAPVSRMPPGADAVAPEIAPGAAPLEAAAASAFAQELCSLLGRRRIDVEA